MLEFNQEHKVVDLSEIKSKTEKSRKTGKVMLCGIMISAVLLLSGCKNEEANTNQQINIVQPNTSSTAIIMENGNALIVDLQSYDKYIRDMGAGKYDTYAVDRTWILYTSTGDKLLVDFDSVKFVDGEDSHKKAETIAQALISENGEVTCYDEVQSYGKTR